MDQWIWASKILTPADTHKLVWESEYRYTKHCLTLRNNNLSEFLHNGQVKICLKNCVHTLWYSNMAVNLTICQTNATEWSKPSQLIPKQISRINPNYYSSIGLNLHVWCLIPIKNMG